MVSNRQSRTIADLERTVRAIATEFKTDSVFIIGSQAILVGFGRNFHRQRRLGPVSKLARLDKKDRTFIEAFDAVRPLDAEVIEKRIRSSPMDPTVADRAVAYIQALTRSRTTMEGENGPGRGGGPL
jgi:hypothetical protein